MTRLEFERRRRGWNQTALAFRGNTTQGTVSLIERRRLLPTPKLVARLADALGIASELLLHEVDEKPDAAEAAIAS